MGSGPVAECTHTHKLSERMIFVLALFLPLSHTPYFFLVYLSLSVGTVRTPCHTNALPLTLCCARRDRVEIVKSELMQLPFSFAPNQMNRHSVSFGDFCHCCVYVRCVCMCRCRRRSPFALPYIVGRNTNFRFSCTLKTRRGMFV